MKKTAMILTGLCLIFALAAAGTYYYTVSAGERSLRQLAKDGGFCKQENCADGVDYAKNFLSAEFGLTPDRVQWCMGVDEIANGKFFLGETIKTAFTEMLYIPCNKDGSLTQPVEGE